MEQVKLFNIRADADGLSRASRGDVDDGLDAPLAAIASDIATRSQKEPLLIYVCSDDDDRALRDSFALAIARLIQLHVPGLLLIDCDFDSPGLGGGVPDAAALGFLDLLLYGSSLKVVSQRAENGVTVVGAGSFPVSRRTPFLMDAFDDTARYLAGAAGCVIFCGPLLDDDEIHPVASHVDLAVLVGREAHPGGHELNRAESKLSAARGNVVWSMRLSESGAGKAAASAADVKDPELDRILSKKTAPSTPERRREKDDEAKKEKAALDAEIEKVIDVPFEEEGADEPLESRTWNTSLPKVVTIALAVLVVGSIAWWLYLTKSFRGGEDGAMSAGDANGKRSAAQVVAGRDASTTMEAGDMDATADSAAVGHVENVAAQEATPVAEPPDVPSRADSMERTAAGQQTATASPGEIQVLQNLGGYEGMYFVHASSFRAMDRVADDVKFLTVHGYEFVVSHVDLGSKGLWYRVYVGPFETEEAAESAKIRLDENSRFRSTRITKVPAK